MKRTITNPPPAATESPAKQVSRFIARFDPRIAKLVRGARAALRKRFFPTAVELIYDTYALVIGFGSTERPSDAIVSLVIYPRGVNLYFIYGAHLADPQNLLEGNGTRGRFIRLTDLTVLDNAGVQELLRAAIELGDTPLPASGRGYTVIKSISAKRRPRRPG